ncbi:MAG: helix-turn-helix transcriptional regulator, partial [Hyphomicrobium sp.]
MNTNEIARIAALVGEPARTAMLLELMGGRSLTANELAIAGNVLPQTASKHLSQLVDAGLLMVSQNGRHRYHRLASANVAKVLEGIMQLASLSRPSEGRKAIFGPRDAGMRRARTCYDHIAGRLGITITDRLLEQGAVVFDGDSGQVTDPAPYA